MHVSLSCVNPGFRTPNSVFPPFPRLLPSPHPFFPTAAVMSLFLFFFFGRLMTLSHETKAKKLGGCLYLFFLGRRAKWLLAGKAGHVARGRNPTKKRREKLRPVGFLCSSQMSFPGWSPFFFVFLSSVFFFPSELCPCTFFYFSFSH